MKRTSVNVLSVVNSSNISTETIDGEEHFIVKGVVPIVDDVVMNGGLYPASEINATYKEMDNCFMPLRHPQINGKYVPASSPEAINKFHVGAYTFNTRKPEDKVMVDMKVNRRVASAHPEGQRLVDRLDAMMNGSAVEPIHVSTGLLLSKQMNSGESKGKKYSWIANNMSWDHVAILLDEPGAATPDQGVGIFVNAEGEDLEHEDANLIDAANYLRVNTWEKVKWFFKGNADMSFDDIHRMLRNAINSDSEPYPWLKSVWSDRFIYQKGKSLYQQSYLITDSSVTLVGDPVEVQQKPVEYVPVTNTEGNPMKDKMVAALNAAGTQTDGLTDDQILSAYNEKVVSDAEKEKEMKAKAEADKKAKEEADKKAVGNQEEAPAWAKDLMLKVNSLEQSITANSQKDLGAKREAVKAKFGLSDVAVNALAGDVLEEMYGKTHHAAALAGGHFQQNRSDETICDQPE